MLKDEMESYVKIEGFENSYVPLQGGRGVKNCQNHPYVINEWPLRAVMSSISLYVNFLVWFFSRCILL